MLPLARTREGYRWRQIALPRQERVYYSLWPLTANTSLQNWFADAELPKVAAVGADEWLVERLRHATAALRGAVDVDPDIRGGVPVLKGTRVPLSQILAEIAEDASVSEVAESFDIDAATIARLLDGIASYLDRPFFK